MKKITFSFFLLLGALSTSSYANVGNGNSEYEQAWLKCKGYEEPRVLRYDDGRVETYCTPKPYRDSSEDVTNIFEKAYFKCEEGERPVCLSSARYYFDQETTLVELHMDLGPLLDSQTTQTPDFDRTSAAIRISQDTMKIILLTLNPNLGRKFQMETDYKETIAFLNSPYSLDTVSIGLVAHDGSSRYVGYAKTDEHSGFLAYKVESNSFATPAQLLFYHCDFSVECKTTVTLE